MSSMTTPVIDYLKIYWPRHADTNGQTTVDEILTIARRGHAILNPKKEQWVFKVMSGKDGKDANFCVEVWGETANYVAQSLPLVHWLKVNRIDLRRTLRQRTDVEMRAFQRRALRMGAKGRNMTILNSKARTKTDSRDVGGQGVVYGSRKSDSHAVIYKRGSELPAVEFRLSGPNCRQLVRDQVYETYFSLREQVPAYNLALVMMASTAALFFERTIGSAFVEEVVSAWIENEQASEELMVAARDRVAAEKSGDPFWYVAAEQMPFEANVFDLNGWCAACGSPARPGEPCPACDPNPVV